MQDKQGREYLKATDAKNGMWVTLDGDFTCVEKDMAVQLEDDTGGLYFHCRDGKHYLEGQWQDGWFVGVYPV